MRQKIYNFVFILIITTIAVFLRLYQLGNIPYGFTNDEIVAVYNAYSITQTHGFDAAKNFLPLNFHAAGNDLTPVPIYLLSLFYAIFSISPFVARFPYALSGIGSVILLYFLVKRFSGSLLLAFFSSLVFAFSPWHLLISRGAWESGVAMFFYLLGFYIFVKNLEKGNILWSLPAFLLAFYSYNADKIFFISLIPFLLWINRKQLLIRKRELILFLSGLACIFFSFLIVLKTNNISRSGVLLWENVGTQTVIAKEVNFSRQKSSGPISLQGIFDNKVVVLGKTFINTYFSFFSPQYLFLYADTDKANGYGLFFWGQLYLVDVVFLIWGLFFSATKFPKHVFMFFLIGLLCAPLPSALSQSNTDSYLFRSSMAIPFLCFFVGTGLYAFFVFLQKQAKYMQIAGITALIFIYGFLVGKFFYSYYFQFATFGSEAYSASSRVLTTYITTHGNTPIFLASYDKELEMQYAFFTKLNPVILQDLWAKKINRVNNLTFAADCNGVVSLGKKIPVHALIVSPQINLENCFPTKNLVYQISDSLEPLRVIWQIHEN